MSRVYKSPPLVEALCEFHFEPSQPWDWTIPGLLYQRLGPTRYPHKEQQNVLEVTVRPGSEEVKQQVKPDMAARIRFLNEQRTTIVQVGPDQLAVNAVREYPGWPAFRDTILATLGQYGEVNPPKGIRRIGVRYINHIKIPGPDPVEIEDYVLALPHVPEPIPQVFSPFMMRVEVPMPDRQAVLVIQTASVPPPRHVGAMFLLDLDCVTKLGSPLATDQYGAWIEQAHSTVEGAFEVCLGPKARDLFEEVRDSGCGPESQ